MASGPWKGRINRSKTWPHPNSAAATQTELANGAPSRQGRRWTAGFGGKADVTRHAQMTSSGLRRYLTCSSGLPAMAVIREGEFGSVHGCYAARIDSFDGRGSEKSFGHAGDARIIRIRVSRRDDNVQTVGQRAPGLLAPPRGSDQVAAGRHE